VRLAKVEARGVEIVATPDEVSDDSIVLSAVRELAPGLATSPQDSLRRVRGPPGSGELEVGVKRPASLTFDREAGEEDAERTPTTVPRWTLRSAI
jgi:hypothetical protein